eukprot:g116.t1 g116   contig1:272758-273762(+)
MIRSQSIRWQLSVLRNLDCLIIRRRCRKLPLYQASALSTSSAITDHDTSTRSTTRPKFKSFFDEVNSQMERDSPKQYSLYLADKAAATSWREMQRQNEQSRNGRPADGVETKSAVEAERVALSNIWSEGGESSDDRALSSPSSRPEDINLSSWGTLGRTESKPSAFTSPPKNSSDDTISSGKTSIFSTISQKANAFNSNPDNATRTTDLLSELFTTTPNKAPPPEPHSAMIYSPNHWENYHEAITSVLSDSKTEKIFDKMEAKGALEKKCVQLVKDWLLSDRRVVEKDVVGDRWKRLDEMWRGGWESGASSIFNRGGEEVETESTGTDEGGEDG